VHHAASQPGVMVTVAKNFNAPIKILFPREWGLTGDVPPHPTLSRFSSRLPQSHVPPRCTRMGDAPTSGAKQCCAAAALGWAGQRAQRTVAVVAHRCGMRLCGCCVAAARCAQEQTECFAELNANITATLLVRPSGSQQAHDAH
jgi:hypothetical protein